ncbi:MAG: TetR/AcrR family transcriptional regulator [Anaerolineales bacterium]|nr:TetR/AcrR family transcriptional regulator [Anaerolineales bacterium]
MPRPDVSDKRKAKILKVARDIFARKPLKDVKMQDIARKAGLSVGGVYWYFKSKDEIVGALLLQNAEENIAVLKTLSETDAPAAARLMTFFERVMASSEDLAELYLTGAKYQSMTSHDPQARAVMEHVGADFQSGIETIIEQGVARGEFIQVNAQDAATALIGAYEGLMLLWVMSPQTMRLKESAQVAAQLLLAGLTASRH